MYFGLHEGIYNLNPDLEDQTGSYYDRIHWWNEDIKPYDMGAVVPDIMFDPSPPENQLLLD